MIKRRPHLLWLLVPYVLFVVALPFVNRGIFLFFWLLGATVLTPLAVGLAHRGDRKRTWKRAEERRS
ncbi:hypothetical protein SLA_2600 [Streptomyces laurentii]|uniref:Uncharacterized protein n=1 Tax=Streptomyces laurentii TaxID=39478 RepID=A0A160NZU9_STRLU|nr:hypothetical protein SLA_2600 [Streptomyces laurentii]